MAGQDEMSCRELVELVTEYLEGALPADQVVRFEEHLDRCPGCAAYLDQMRATVASLGRLEEWALHAAAREELVAAFRASRGESVR